MLAHGLVKVKNHEYAITLRKRGWTFQDIGQHFGVSRQRIHKILR